MKKAFLPIALILLLAALCSAEMTVWFKDGTSVRAYKVVFHGQDADITLMDGNVKSVKVSTMDLQSSGILKPEGTYGGTGTGPAHLPTSTPPVPVNQSARQASLKAEWEKAEEKAVALKDLGPIHKGDVVRIASQTDASSQNGYYGLPEGTQEGAYIILYQNADGTYGKKLFDAATFASVFKIEEKKPEAVTMPLEPAIPETKPADEAAPGARPPGEKAAEPHPAGSSPEKLPAAKPAEPAPQEASRNYLPFVLVVGGFVIAMILVALLLRRGKKAFVDASKFKQYEEELRDFELEIWLKHGRTQEQLMEVGVKKFYADQPGPLAVAQRMLQGVDRNAAIALIVRHSGLDAASAAPIYEEMKRRQDWIRDAIQSVSRKTGRTPLVESAPAPTGIIPVPAQRPGPRPAAAQEPPARPQAPTGIMPMPAPPQKPAPAPKPVPAQKAPAPSPVTPEIPDYLAGVLRNLTALSDPRD